MDVQERKTIPHADERPPPPGRQVHGHGSNALYSSGGGSTTDCGRGGGHHSMQQFAHGGDGGGDNGRPSMQLNARASAQLHPSLQNPPRQAQRKHDLVISLQNCHVSKILDIIAVLNPVTTPPKGFTDDLKVVVYSYNDAPTPPPSCQLLVISFIEVDAFNKIFVSAPDPLSQYAIAVKLPSSVTNHVDYRNSGDFSKFASNLRSSNLVAILADKTRIGFLRPNDCCNHSASVYFCTNVEAEQRIRVQLLSSQPARSLSNSINVASVSKRKIEEDHTLHLCPHGLQGRWVPPPSIQGQSIPHPSIQRQSIPPPSLSPRKKPRQQLAQLIQGVLPGDAASEPVLAASVSVDNPRVTTERVSIENEDQSSPSTAPAPEWISEGAALDALKRKHAQSVSNWERRWHKKIESRGAEPSLHLAEELTHSKKPVIPQRKAPAKHPSEVGLNEFQYESIRQDGLRKISQCRAMGIEYYPHLGMQLFQVIKNIGPKDLVVLIGNHCGTQWYRGCHNLHAHLGCRDRDGYVMEENCSTRGNEGNSQYFEDKSSLKFGDSFAQSTLQFNFWEWCRTINKKFQRCAHGTEEMGAVLAELIQTFLDVITSLHGFAIVFSTAGMASNMQLYVLSKLKPSANTMIANDIEQPYHIQHTQVPPTGMSSDECAENLVRQYTGLSNRIMPFLEQALGYRPQTSFLQHALNSRLLPLVTLDTKEYDETLFCYDVGYIDSLLQACWAVMRRKNAALVKDVRDGDDPDGRIKRYAGNHLGKIRERYSRNAGDALADSVASPANLAIAEVPIRGILRCMGSNSQELQKKKLGNDGYLQRMSKMREASVASRASLAEELPPNFKLDWRKVPPKPPLVRKTIRKNASNIRSDYVGVYWQTRRGKWKTEIQFGGKTFHLGFHDEEVEAAKVYAGAVHMYKRYMQKR